MSSRPARGCSVARWLSRNRFGTTPSSSAPGTSVALDAAPRLPEDAGDGPARVYAAIANSGDGKGLSHAELRAAVGGDAAIVSGWVEELQSDGSIYQGADGRLLLL